jgi:signal transduction histidine kinase
MNPLISFLPGIRISLDLIPPLGVSEGTPLITMTDPVRLGQVIINLLSNAIRFTDKAASHRREIKIKIQVSARPPADESCICPSSSEPIRPGEPCWIYGAVEDSGPGLAPEELSMLFRR